MYSYDKTDEVTGMRVVEHYLNKKQKERISIDYWAFVLLFILFLFFFFQGLSDHMEGNTYGAGWHWAWCAISLPGVLLFGIPTIFKAVKIVKYRKIVKKDNCIWATVKTINCISHILKKDEYWIWCDIVCANNQTIYRYKSEIVNDNLFWRFKEGDRIAIYLNPEDPEDYYVDLGEKQ